MKQYLIQWAVALIGLYMLTGCVAMSGTTKTDTKTLDQADLVFIGLPAPLSWFTGGMQGTVFPVSGDTSLTAAHVSGPLLKSVRAQHPVCDVAAISRNNDGKRLHRLATAVEGMTVTAYGYSAITGLPKSGTGIVIGMIRRNGCMYGIIGGGGGVAGMSGGPVVNADGETVGVVTDVVLGRGQVLFVPVQSFQNVLSRLNIPYKVHKP